MDYSLLIGIHDRDRAMMEAEEHEEQENGTHVRLYFIINLYLLDVGSGLNVEL